MYEVVESPVQELRGASQPYGVRHYAYKPNPFAKPFVGWDSEGYTADDGSHRLMLFGCSSGENIISDDIGPFECFDLLLKVAATRPAIHVIFAGGYDVIMMLRKFPEKTVKRIMQGSPTWVNNYRIEYRKSKFLRIGHKQKGSVTLYDVFTFFACSFVRACREYLGENEDFDRIEEVKQLRSGFTLESVRTLVVPYWQQELKYLVQLCTILRKRLVDAGIRPSQWHGPGAVAQAVLRSKGTKAFMADTGTEVKEAARHAYFGGRFEQFQAGYRHTTTYQYDIRSAYPAAITRLPSLANVEWRHRKQPKRLSPYGVYYVSYRSHETIGLDRPAPYPWRSQNGSIYYPHDLSGGWYWGIEVLNAIQHAPGKTTVHEGWEPSSDVFDYPFTWVRDMYDDRAKMKAEGNPTQLALKLALNSLYGKMAQSKGAKQIDADKWQIPTYHQLEWAGWITAATRAKLYALMVQAGRGLIAVETDAVYSSVELTCDCGPNLGQWEREELDAILYIQSGVYFKKDAGTWKLKSRGFEPRNHTFEAWQTVMSKLPHDPTAAVTSRSNRFGSIPGRDNFATWYESVRESRILGTHSKRIHEAALCEGCTVGYSLAEGMHTLIVPEHLINAATEPSKPHRLPWIDGIAAWATTMDELVITEEGYTVLDFNDGWEVL